MYTLTDNTYAHVALSIAHEVRERTALLLGASLLILVVLYGYFLASTIVLAVEHKEAQHEAAAIGSQIVDLEVAYLKTQAHVTDERAVDLGLMALAGKEYIERASYVRRASAE